MEDMVGPRLVITGEKQQTPLTKARVSNVVGAAGSRAADRAPGPTSVANFIFNTPAPTRPQTVLPEDLMSIDQLGREVRIKLDKETFKVQEPFHKEPQMLVIPMSELDSEEVERNRKHLEEMRLGNIGQKNQTPVEKDDD
jgi:hypothetical protein